MDRSPAITALFLSFNVCLILDSLGDPLNPTAHCLVGLASPPLMLYLPYLLTSLRNVSLKLELLINHVFNPLVGKF